MGHFAPGRYWCEAVEKHAYHSWYQVLLQYRYLVLVLIALYYVLYILIPS